MAQLFEVSTATPTHDAALRLAESAIRSGLAAGGQVTGPVASLFWHNGESRQCGLVVSTMLDAPALSA